jgi:hypothetical protein
MNLRRGRRALRGIERDLADSDPRLSMLFVSFAELAKGEEMPGMEKIRTRPLRLLGRLRLADRYRSGEDWRTAY